MEVIETDYRTPVSSSTRFSLFDRPPALKAPRWDWFACAISPLHPAEAFDALRENFSTEGTHGGAAIGNRLYILPVASRLRPNGLFDLLESWEMIHGLTRGVSLPQRPPC